MSNKEYSLRDLLLFCRSEMEVIDIRNNVLKEIKDTHVSHYFSTLSADCLRFLEVLKRAGIHANNIDQVAEWIIADKALAPSIDGIIPGQSPAADKGGLKHA